MYGSTIAVLVSEVLKEADDGRVEIQKLKQRLGCNPELRLFQLWGRLSKAAMVGAYEGLTHAVF